MTFQTEIAPSPHMEVSQNLLPPQQLPAPETLQNTTTNAEGMREMEQAWEELLSIPELQVGLLLWRLLYKPIAYKFWLSQCDFFYFF